MIITAIKYRSNGNQDPEVFRFTGGTAGLRHAVCFQTANDISKEKANAALAMVLNGIPSNLISDAAIQIADSAGDTWVMTRGTQGFAVSKNGESLTREQIRTSLISALLDLDLAGGNGSNPDGEHIAAILDVRRGPNGRPSLSPWSAVDHRQTPAMDKPASIKGLPDFKNFVEGSMKVASSKIASVLGAAIIDLAAEDPAVLQRLIDDVEPLTREARAIQEQLKNIETPGSFSRDEQRRLEHLIPEIELIDKIKALALPLLDPAEGISAIQDRLRALDHELTLRLSSFGVQKSPNLLHSLLNREWRKALGCLARYQATKALQEQWAAILGSTRDELDPLITEHIHSVDQSIRRDDELSAELEASIQMLRLKMSPAPSSLMQYHSPVHAQITREQSPQTWFDKLKDSIHGSTQPSQTQAPVRAAEFPPRIFVEMLETTQATLESTTKRLEVMQNHVAAIRSDIDSQRDGLAGAMARLEKECATAHAEWLEMAHLTGLGSEGADFRVEQLVELLLNRIELIKLEEEKEELREKMRDRLARFETLERLIIEWRQLTNSQKAADLSHPGIILGEARSIIRYREEKQRVVARLSQVRERSKSMAQKLAHLDERAKNLNTAWEKTLKDLRLPAVTTTDPRWDEALAAAKRLQTMTVVIADFNDFNSTSAMSRKALNDRALDEAAHEFAQGKPVHIYNWQIASSNHVEREDFIKFIQEQGSGSLLLILCSDPELAREMHLHGSGRSIEVRPTPMRSPSEPKLLNTKARQALAALTNTRK
jgi:hypothetical protein